jgi:hypothetical protein
MIHGLIFRGRICISRRPLGWTGGGMPLFSRVRSVRLLILWLVLVLSLVCPAQMENTVFLPPPFCLLSILLAIFVWPPLLLLGIDNFWVFWCIRIVCWCSEPLFWLLCQLTHSRVLLCGPWSTRTLFAIKWINKRYHTLNCKLL